MPTNVRAWEDFAKAGMLEEAIVTYVEERDYVTFAELQRDLGEYRDLAGDWALEIWPNGILWAGMSEEFQQAFRKLVEQERIKTEPAAPLCYLMDGMVPRFPIAKRVPRDKAKGYAKPYWIPVCLRPWEE
jgi:hypothetical protein